MMNHEQEVLAKLHDIYGIEQVPFWQTSLFYVLVIGIGMVMIAVVTWCVLRRLRKRAQQPWEWALQELDRLERRGLIQGDQSKLFYHELTRIIKEYLQLRFTTSLVGKTDDELMEFSASLDITDDVGQGLRDIFDGVIFIKWAQAAAARERMQRDLLAGKTLIIATRPQKK